MEVTTKIELKVKNFEEIFTTITSDCPLGKLYDYSCALKYFVTQKMQEADAQNQNVKKEDKA